MLSNIESNPKMTMIEGKNSALLVYKSNDEYRFAIPSPGVEPGLIGEMSLTRGM